MAVKDHSLDPKIIQAAKAEFMEKGYQKASLHEIARKAGITTGALYTRYKSKNDLFLSLVCEIFPSAKTLGERMQDRYTAAQKQRSLQGILEAIHQEQELYCQLMFRHYDACVLLYCKSAGSSVEAALNQMMDLKIEQTVAYFKAISRTDLDLDGIGLLISQQFQCYRRILEQGYSKEKALACLQLLSLYQQAGWQALLSAIL